MVSVGDEWEGHVIPCRGTEEEGGRGGRGEEDEAHVNPFTVPACKTSGLKNARTRIYFPVL